MPGCLGKVSLSLDRKVEIIQTGKQESTLPGWSRRGDRVDQGTQPERSMVYRRLGSRGLSWEGWLGPDHVGPGMLDNGAWTVATENLRLAGGMVTTRTACEKEQ